MTRIIAVIFGVMFSCAVFAYPLDFEIGVGQSHYKTAHDGLWYQEAYPHTADLKDNAFSLGFSKAYGANRYRLEYITLGWVYNSAQYVGDQNYYAGTNTKAAGQLLGRGSVAGAVLSASRDVRIMGMPFYAEGGAFVYVPKWQVTACPFGSDTCRDFITQSSVRVGPVVGAGIRYSGIDVGVRYYGLQMNNGDICPPIYSSAFTLMVKVYF